MTTTQNLHLPQWEADDRIMRTDFNDAMAKLDTLPRIVTGTYTGDGEREHTITLGFKPQFMLITQTIPSERNSDTYYLWLIGDYTKLVTPETSTTTMVGPYISGTTEMFLARRSDTGVTFVKHPNWGGYYNMNISGKQYSYFAIG